MSPVAVAPGRPSRACSTPGAATAGFFCMETIGQYKIHPGASVFPLLEGNDWWELLYDIQEIGLRHPIVRHKGLVVDGRNRLRACVDSVPPIEPKFTDLPDDADPWHYIISTNLLRRHMTADERAAAVTLMTAAEEEEKAKARHKEGSSRGGQSKVVVQVPPPSAPAKTRDIIAEKAKVGQTKAQAALNVRKADIANGTNLLAEVAAGKKTLKEAMNILKDVVPPSAKNSNHIRKPAKRTRSAGGSIAKIINGLNKDEYYELIEYLQRNHPEFCKDCGAGSGKA